MLVINGIFMVKLLGISGSPIPESNTDRAVKAVLKASGLDYEFVKLSDLHIRPCLACRRCVKDNRCKQEDDFPRLSEKVLKADALVIGAYTPYSQIDAFTKAFLERLWSLRHVNNLLKDKPVVIIVTGVYPTILNKPILRYTGLNSLLKRSKLPSEKVKRNLALEMTMDRMQVIGQVIIKGNVPCLTCGHGNECEMSGVPFIHGKNAKASTDLCTRVEDQEVWNELQSLGNKLKEKLNNKS